MTADDPRLPPTLNEMIRDVGRELGMRRANYPRWVASGRLTQEKADHQIACMDAVYGLLKKLVVDEQQHGERPKP